MQIRDRLLDLFPFLVAKIINNGHLMKSNKRNELSKICKLLICQ